MIDQNFTHQAPAEYLDPAGEKITVTQHYIGPEKFSVLVNRESKKITTVCFDYDEDQDLSDDKHYEVTIDFNNENHRVLMDMLTNCEGYDWSGPTQTEDLGTVEGWTMTYTRPSVQNTVHYFDRLETTVEEDGTVNYAWIQNHMTWADLDGQIDANIAQLKKDRDAVETVEIQEKFNKAIRIFEHIKYNMRNVAPHKIPFPNVMDL